MLKPVIVIGLLQMFAVGFVPLQTDVDPCDGVKTDSWVNVTVHGIMSDEGLIRAQVYSDDPAEFLRKGKKLVRTEISSTIDITNLCVPLPGPGQYSLVVMHDRNANGRADFYSDGFGFSNNPRLSLSAPDHSDTLFNASNGGMTLDVFLRYMLFGRLSPGDPWTVPASNDDTHQDALPGMVEIKPSPEMN